MLKFHLDGSSIVLDENHLQMTNFNCIRLDVVFGVVKLPSHV